MLKITITQTLEAQRWVLEGRLTQPWSAELERQWRQTHAARQGCVCVVDLHDVTSIDRHGRRVLRMMLGEGTQFRASGVFTTYLLAALARQQPGRRRARDGGTMPGRDTHAGPAAGEDELP
jgi:hypothetical protein